MGGVPVLTLFRNGEGLLYPCSLDGRASVAGFSFLGEGVDFLFKRELFVLFVEK